MHGENKNAHSILVGKLEEIKPFLRPKTRWDIQERE
jgi:hypothetical protein